MKYDHYTYGRMIAGRLKGINDFLESVGDEDPAEIDSRILNAKLPMLIAVDGCDTDFQLHDDEHLTGYRTYVFILLDRAPDSHFRSILEARKRCLELSGHIVGRLFHDYIDEAGGLEYLDTESIKVSPVGPFGDNLYGLSLEFSINPPMSYVLDPTVWL